MTTRTKEELDKLAAETEEYLDNLDPATIEWQDMSDLSAIARADDVVTVAKRSLLEAVAAARANGRSWGLIGMRLGVSKQAAQERFAEKVRDPAVRGAPVL